LPHLEDAPESAVVAGAAGANEAIGAADPGAVRNGPISTPVDEPAAAG
jgi:hypothetical protein